MTSDEDQPTDRAGAAHSASGAHVGDGWSGPVTDPIRDIILGFAAQIDQLAALFGGGHGGHRAATGTATTGTVVTGTMAGTTLGGDPAPGAGGGASAPNLTELTGEVTGLLAEIGDILARLIAALIAVLEAIAAALRSTPSSSAQPGPRNYQPISVRIDPEGRGKHAAEPEPEGGV